MPCERSKTSATIGGQCSRRASCPMNSPRCPPLVVRWVMSRGGVETVLARAKTCCGGVMWSVSPASRFSGQRMRRRSTRARHGQLAPDERVVAEQVLDDPQIERARDVLRVLEPVLEGAVARDVLRVVDVGEQLQLLGDLVLGPDGDEAPEHELALHDAAAEAPPRPGRSRDRRGEQLARSRGSPLAGVEVDRRAGDRERLHRLRVQGGVDRRQPAALAVADQVDRAADLVDRAVHERR